MLRSLATQMKNVLISALALAVVVNVAYAAVRYPPASLLQPNDVTSSHISDGTIVNADVSATAAIVASKLSGVAASGANSDITSLTGLTTALSVTQGGTGRTSFDPFTVMTTNGTGQPGAFPRGTGNQILGINSAGSTHEYKTITAGTGITVSHAANAITITNDTEPFAVDPWMEWTLREDTAVTDRTNGTATGAHTRASLRSMITVVGTGNARAFEVATSTAMAGGDSPLPLSWDTDQRLSMFVGRTATSTETDSYWGMGLAGAARPPLNTATTTRHAGFINWDGIVMASVADGTTQATTTIGSTDGNFHHYTIDWDAGVNAKFYVDEVLKATISTNLPSGGLNYSPLFAALEFVAGPGNDPYLDYMTPVRLWFKP